MPAWIAPKTTDMSTTKKLLMLYCRARAGTRGQLLYAQAAAKARRQGRTEPSAIQREPMKKTSAMTQKDIDCDSAYKKFE